MDENGNRQILSVLNIDHHEAIIDSTLFFLKLPPKKDKARTKPLFKGSLQRPSPQKESLVPHLFWTFAVLGRGCLSELRFQVGYGNQSSRM